MLVTDTLALHPAGGCLLAKSHGQAAQRAASDVSSAHVANSHAAVLVALPGWQLQSHLAGMLLKWCVSCTKHCHGQPQGWASLQPVSGIAPEHP